MRTVAFVCAAAACAGGADAFAGSMRPASASVRRAGPSSVRMASDMTVPELLKKTEELKLLSTASKLGLLSKLEKAGLTLKDVERLLPLVDENDLIGLAKGLGPDLLKVAPSALAAAPAALPLLAAGLGVPGETLYLAALGSFAAGAGLVTVLPDDSVTSIALETFVAFPLLFVFPAVLGVAGFALTGLNHRNGSLVNLITSFKPATVPAGSSPSPATKAIKAAKSSASDVQKVAKSSASKAVKAAKSSGGRPSAAARPVAALQEKMAPKAKPAPKKVRLNTQAAPKPAPKPKPAGNIANIPKAL
ncbi:unnamed protein product [Pylaiella littoralis]